MVERNWGCGVSIRVLLLAGIWMRIFPRFLSVILFIFLEEERAFGVTIYKECLMTYYVARSDWLYILIESLALVRNLKQVLFNMGCKRPRFLT